MGIHAASQLHGGGGGVPQGADDRTQCQQRLQSRRLPHQSRPLRRGSLHRHHRSRPRLLQRHRCCRRSQGATTGEEVVGRDRSVDLRLGDDEEVRGGNAAEFGHHGRRLDTLQVQEVAGLRGDISL